MRIPEGGRAYGWETAGLGPSTQGALAPALPLAPGIDRRPQGTTSFSLDGQGPSGNSVGLELPTGQSHCHCRGPLNLLPGQEPLEACGRGWTACFLLSGTPEACSAHSPFSQRTLRGAHPGQGATKTSTM